ncbi:MAG: hypothetical protein KBS97_03990 [Firmicutes bacterium]|nr:hypothetical protein [Candidatus Fiminaster equi]
MKIRKSFILLALSGTVLASVSASLFAKSPAQKAKDFTKDYNFSNELYADYAHPVFAADEEDPEPAVVVNKVILNYVNEDGQCAGEKGRAFYVWGGSNKGYEYNEIDNPDIVTASANLMTITIDFTKDPFKGYAGSQSIMYIIKFKHQGSDLNWGGQSEDVEVRFDEFEPDGEGTVTVWCTPAAGGGIAQFKTEEETKVDGIKLGKFLDWRTIKCVMTNNSRIVDWNLYAFDETYYRVKAKQRSAIKRNYIVASGRSSLALFNIELKYDAHINLVYCIESHDTAGKANMLKTVYVSMEELYKTKEFQDYFSYNKNDPTSAERYKNLGVTYKNTETHFKVWSPVAANISVLIYDTDTTTPYGGDEKYRGFHLCYQPGGLWELTIKGDLKGKYYNYQVDTWIGTNVCMDPYATSAGANGIRGYIYDKTEANPENWNAIPTKWDGVTGYDISTPQQLTVYEVHMQDFTGDSSWGGTEKPGTYNAFVEEGTTYTDGNVTVSTGFDHLKELGLNAVQLLPVFDHDNDEVYKPEYNWGYNPLNYNVVEGVYSTDPHNGLTRVKEFKNMVLKLAQSGIRVIMDVVYNHVSSPTASCFNKLMPRYYFRYDEKGELYDGSGCHNEFRSEATMARKFIVDSVSMWAKEYKIKGFRFDLMELIDVETMKAIKKAMYEIDPDIVLYGEGWSMGFNGGWDFENNKQSMGTGTENVYHEAYDAANEVSLGGFNDRMRNALKGENNLYAYEWSDAQQKYVKGTNIDGSFFAFISQGVHDANEKGESRRLVIEKGIQGFASGWGGEDINCNNPRQTINYVSCHDNWTIRDQLYISLGSDGNPYSGNQAAYAADVKHGSLAIHGAIFASNGIAFMQGGEEILRTKDIDVVKDKKIFDEIPKDSYELAYGHHLSHNSYNSPLEVNTFKWGNKISVTMDRVKGGDSDTVSTLDMTAIFANLIKIHQTMHKYSAEEIASKVKGSWKGSDKDGGENESCIGVQYDKYFIYLTGREYGYQGWVDFSSWTELHHSGTTAYDQSKQELYLGDFGYNKGLAIRVYEAH